jgi:hypothetical protein
VPTEWREASDTPRVDREPDVGESKTHHYWSKEVNHEMESQPAEKKEELLLELKAKNTTRTVKDFSPAGIRLEDNFEGRSTGVYNASHYGTITVLVRPDGTNEYEVRQIDTTSDGDTILLYFKGKSVRETPTHNIFVGDTTFQTASTSLAWLNGLKARHEGEYNPATGIETLRVYGRR